MPNLLDIIDPNNRIRYEQLAEFIDDCPISTFTDQATFNFLVGKELYEGDIRKIKSKKEKPGEVSESTMMFRPSIVPSSVKAIARVKTDNSRHKNSGITHALYAVRKKFYSNSEANVISIGRARDNDIVIADYVISKHHAQIINFHEMFFVVDLNSTNGSQINHKKVTPQMKIQLDINSTIAFGRFAFVFMSPLELYKTLRRKFLT